jgi:polyvinyl alcohol dehydrogenase (cytochrome)
VIVAVAAVGVISVGIADAGTGGNQWTSAGQNIQNTRSNSAESKIGVGNVATLQKKWEFTTGGDVSATPAVDGANVYFPDWAGNLYAVNRATGQQVWKVSIAQATGIPGDKARTTPALTDTKLYIGTMGPFGGSTRMLAFDKSTGALLWSTQLDTHPAALITQSAVVHAGRLYIGTSSQEEAFSLIPGYPCCSFRGSVYALDADTGAVLWRTFTVPPGWPGGAVWGSTPAVDPSRGQLYITTGNNYNIPDSALACVDAAGGDPAFVRACIDPADHIDSILALDLKTGAIRWATSALPFDAWTVDCIPGIGDGSNCPEPAGPDYDFGQGAQLFTVRNGNGKPLDLVGAGQKSGQYWALNPDTGQVAWVTTAGPGGTAGGLQWGSAVDGLRVYTADSNSNFKPWTMPDGSVVTSGMWSGLDAATGQLLWQTAPPHGGGASGPATTANGVMYGCSLDPEGYMYALNGATGAVLWQFKSGGSCLSGAAISNGEVYWGSGYSNFGFGTPNNKLFKFGLP